MESNLDETHRDLTRMASSLRPRPVDSLDEAKKPRFKVKKPGDGLSRVERKQQAKQEKLYGGREPLGADSGKPYVPPGSRPKTPATPSAVTPAQKPERPKHPRGALIPPGLPKTIKAVDPAKPIEPVKVVSPPAEVAKIAAKQDEPDAPWTPSAPATPVRTPSLLSRLGKKAANRLFGGKKEPAQAPGTPTPSRFQRLKGFMKGIAKFIGGRKRLNENVMIPRTIAAMQLIEQRSSTTFKPCKERAMVSTAHLRHSMPKNTFVKPSKDNPTFPVRTDCRASLAGVGRALQKDMANPDENVKDQVIRRVNSTTGGTRGRLSLKLWGTGVGGQRMETFRGKPGTPKRTDELAKKLGISKKEASKLHGVSTGKADHQKHTSPYSPAGGSKGPAGNREVPRHPLANAKSPVNETGKKTKRQEKREAGKIGRGQARIGR